MTTRKGMEGIWPPLALSFLLGEKGCVAQKQPCYCCQSFWPCPPSGCCWSKGYIGTGASADSNWQYLLPSWPVQLLWPGPLKVLSQGSGCTRSV